MKRVLILIGCLIILFAASVQAQSATTRTAQQGVYQNSTTNFTWHTLLVKTDAIITVKLDGTSSTDTLWIAWDKDSTAAHLFPLVHNEAKSYPQRASKYVGVKGNGTLGYRICVE